MKKTPEIPGVSKNRFFTKLGEGKDVSEKCDGAEIQNRDNSSHRHFFTRMKSVHFFHEIGF